MSGAAVRWSLAAVALVAVAGGVAAVVSCSKGPAAPKRYEVNLVGDPADEPWNKTLYVTFENDGKLTPPSGVIFDPDAPFTYVEHTPGSGYMFLSEVDPTPAIRSLLWMVNAKGTLDDRDVINVPLPKRTALRIEGNPAEPEDALTIASLDSGARLCAVRNETAGMQWGIWDAQPAADRVKALGHKADEWRGTRDTAPPRPWVWRESKAGTFAIGVRSGNRQWLVQRIALKAGETVTIDATHQPPGGATITCEDARAELILAGDLPLPPLRTSDVTFRAVWTNVPPGTHTLRYPDGRSVPVECADAADLKFGK